MGNKKPGCVIRSPCYCACSRNTEMQLSGLVGQQGKSPEVRVISRSCERENRTLDLEAQYRSKQASHAAVAFGCWYVKDVKERDNVNLSETGGPGRGVARPDHSRRKQITRIKIWTANLLGLRFSPLRIFTLGVLDLMIEQCMNLRGRRNAA
jgi:hypothetical protein